MQDFCFCPIFHELNSKIEDFYYVPKRVLSANQLHAPSKLAASVALCCVIKLHILECPFIVASLRHTCAIIMLSNQHLDMPHL